MTPIRQILFPYDFSTQGQRVAPFVRALASSLDADLTILSVIPPAFDSVPADMQPRIRVGDVVGEWKQDLQSRLDRALTEEFAGLRVERLVDYGDPSFRIVDVAGNRGADVIMMPTHGAGVFRRLLLGSVASRVLHDAACPVWTAAHAEEQTASARPRTILCAVDGADRAAAVVQYATGFAAQVGARLSFVHVVGPVSDWPTLESERRLQAHVRDEAHAAMTSLMVRAGADAPFRVVVGNVVEAVAEHAREELADLIIIGRGAVAEPFGRLRAHALGILHRSACPVLSVA